jgi:hypothetical protein
MKKFFILIVACLMVSCMPQKKSYSNLHDDGLPVTRRYIGNFIDYHYTGPEIFGGVGLIWIRTTQFSSFGKISAYGKDCNFKPNEKLYLRRLYSTPGLYGNWEYQIENDSSVIYRMSDFRYENNVLVQVSF